MQSSRQLLLLGILVLIGNLPALVVAALLRSAWGTEVLCALVKNAQGFAATAASFAFSMLGFLAAAMALFSILGQTKTFSGYVKNGYLSIVLMLAGVAMLELALAFGAALRLFFDPLTSSKLACALVALVAAVSMVLLTVAPVIGLQIRAANEPGTQ